MTTTNPMPKSVQELWFRLTLVWSLAWIAGIVLFLFVAIFLANRYFKDQVEARLRIQAIAIYGLAFYEENGTFRSDLLNYEDDLFEPTTKFWLVEPGPPIRFRLGEEQENIPDETLIEIAQDVVDSAIETLDEGIDMFGSPYKILAIPTYQGTSDIPKAAILVATDPTSNTRAMYFFLAGSVAVATILGLSGIAVGAFMANQSLTPLSDFMSKREQFLSAAAHELRTPIASLKAVVEAAILNKESLPPSLARINSLVDNATLTMEDLLLFSRLDAGKIKLELQLTRLDLLVEKCLPEELRLHYRAIETTVKCDHSLVETAIRNLLANSLRHASTPQAIEVVVTKNAVTITDDGGGFPENVLKSFAEGQTILPSNQGSGFGLASARMIAELHNAKLTLTNIGPNLSSSSFSFGDLD